MPIVKRFDQDPVLATITGFVLGRQEKKRREDAEKKAEEANEGNMAGLGSGVGTALGAILAIPTGGLSIAAGAAIGGAVGGVGGAFIKTSGQNAQTLNTVGGAIGSIAQVAAQMEQEKVVTDNVRSLAEATKDMKPEERLSAFEAAAARGDLGPEIQQKALGNIVNLASEVTFADIKSASKKGKSLTEEESAKFEDFLTGIANTESPTEVMELLAQMGGSPKQVFDRAFDLAEMQREVLETNGKISKSQGAELDNLMGIYRRRMADDPEQFARDMSAGINKRRRQATATSGRALAFAGEPGKLAKLAHDAGSVTTGRSNEELLMHMQQLGKSATAANGFSGEQIRDITRNVIGAGEVFNGPLPNVPKGRFLQSLLEETRAITPSGPKQDGRSAVTQIMDDVVKNFDTSTGLFPSSITMPDGTKIGVTQGKPLRQGTNEQFEADRYSREGIPLMRDGSLPGNIPAFKDWMDDQTALIKIRSDFEKSLLDESLGQEERVSELARIRREVFPDDLPDRLHQKYIDTFRDPNFMKRRNDPVAPSAPAPPAPAVPDGSPDSIGAATGRTGKLNQDQQRILDTVFQRFEANPQSNPNAAATALNRIVSEIEAAGGNVSDLNEQDSFRIRRLFAVVQRAQAQGEQRQRSAREAAVAP